MINKCFIFGKYQIVTTSQLIRFSGLIWFHLHTVTLNMVPMALLKLSETLIKKIENCMCRFWGWGGVGTPPFQASSYLAMSITRSRSQYTLTKSDLNLKSTLSTHQLNSDSLIDTCYLFFFDVCRTFY